MITTTNYYSMTLDYADGLPSEDQIAHVLCLDSAFVSEKWPGLAAFPRFDFSGEVRGGRPTFREWRAVGVHLSLGRASMAPDPAEWHSYVEDGEGGFEAVTLRDVLARAAHWPLRR